MKKIFDFGKIDYTGTGRKSYLVTVEMEYKEKNNGEKVLSICGNIWNTRLTTETITAQNSLKRRILNAAQNGETVETTAAEQVLLSLEYSVKSETETLPETIAEFYKFKETETKLCGWLHPGEHSRGILGKACPVCGYKYGHAWNYFPIPEQDEQAIYKLLEG